MVMTKPYLEQMRAHVDEGGQLDHRNGVDLLAEVERLNQCVETAAASGAARAWSILTKSHGGTVSVLRELTLVEARQIYQRLDPWFGMHSTQIRYPDGTTCPIRSARTVADGEIDVLHVFGPPGWDASEVREWRGKWPKIKTINVDEKGRPLPAQPQSVESA